MSHTQVARYVVSQAGKHTSLTGSRHLHCGPQCHQQRGSSTVCTSNSLHGTPSPGPWVLFTLLFRTLINSLIAQLVKNLPNQCRRMCTENHGTREAGNFQSLVKGEALHVQVWEWSLLFFCFFVFKWKWKSLSRYSPWNSPGHNTGVGSHSLLQGIFPTQGLNPGLSHCRRTLYQLSHKGSPLFHK